MAFKNYAHLKQQSHSSRSSRGTRTTEPRKTQKRADCKSKPVTRIVLKLKYKDGEVQYAENPGQPTNQFLAKSDGSDANPALGGGTALAHPGDLIHPDEGLPRTDPATADAASPIVGSTHTEAPQNLLPPSPELPEDRGQPKANASLGQRSRCIGKKKRSRIKKETVRKGSARIQANRRGEEQNDAKPVTRSRRNESALDKIKQEPLPMSTEEGGVKHEGTEPTEAPEDRGYQNRKKQKVAKIEQQKCQYSAEEIEHWFSDENLRRLGLYIDPLYPSKSELVCYEVKTEEPEWSYGMHYEDLQLLRMHTPSEMFPQEEGDWSQLTRKESNKEIGSFEHFNELFKKHVECGNAEKQEMLGVDVTRLDPGEYVNRLSSVNSEGMVNTYSNNLMMVNQMPAYRLPQLQNYLVLHDRYGQDWANEEGKAMLDPGVNKDSYSVDPTMENGQSYFAPSVMAGLLPPTSYYIDPTDHGHAAAGFQSGMFQNGMFQSGMFQN